MQVSSINLSEFDSVYADRPRSGLEGLPGFLNQAEIVMALDKSPIALGRVFSLLAVVRLIPQSTETAVREDELVEIRIVFESVSELRFDLLCRKLQQLTETITLSAGAA